MAQFVTFDKIVPEGKAMSHWHDKALFAIGPLPGESAMVRITREKRGWAEGVVREYGKGASPHRGPAMEDHYMSCSPWQGVSYEYQLELKRGMLAELFGRPELKLEVPDMTASKDQIGYRNKLEFTLQADESGKLGLAFHERGSFKNLVAAPKGCVLGHDDMNRAALAIAERLNTLEALEFADTLTVRRSEATGAVIAVLLVRESADRDWTRLVVPEVQGIAVVRKLKHATFETLWGHGPTDLSEQVAGVGINYPWDAFFQVNVGAFSLALEAILANIKPGSRVIDLYGGVGTIGLPAAGIAREVVGVEVIQSSVDLANQNAQLNKLPNYRAVAVASENMDPAIFSGADTVILDPPRAGLHAKVISMLLAARPRQIIYLSCNPVTQVRDAMLLAPTYTVGRPSGFDFYPGTLHLESLVVLELSA